MGNFNSKYPISFTLSWDLHVFIHMPGDEIWLSYISFPVGMSYLQLDVNNTNGMRASDIAITENEMYAYEKLKAPCVSYMLKVIKL